MLSWQSRETFDEKAKSALDESQNRVRSMSLIHKNLYQEDNLTGINMKEYINNLSEHLISTYSVSGEITFSSEIADIRLDVDTVVPLGLIINELISNSLKYAFKERDYGEIFIKLSEENNKLILLVNDNGIGISEIDSLGGQNSFGYNLIKAFSDRLDAELVISGDEGTEVTLAISDYIKS